MKIRIKKLNDRAIMPFKAYPTDAGWDIVATSRTYEGGCYVYGTGLAIEIPEGYYADLRPRSSISNTHLILCNGPGTLDSHFRGEIKFKFYPLNDHPNLYAVGDRIGQLVLKKIEDCEFEWSDELSETDRGKGGFGSTGK